MRGLEGRWLFLVAGAMLAVAGCGGSEEEKTPSFVELFPANNAVSGWSENTTVGAAGVESATTDLAVEGLIDGAAEPFIARDWVAFGWQQYVNGSYHIDLQMWQMASAAVATDLYTGLLVEGRYDTTFWETITLGDESRVWDTQSQLTGWWFNVRSGAYYLEAAVTPNDADARTAAETFLAAIVADLP